MHLARSTPLSLLLALSLHAQQEPQDSFGHSRHGSEFDEGPRQAAYLMEGMNPDLHFQVSTDNELAQQFFNQGICQLHGFWYFEAERSFRQAALLDPDCAMAYWGMCVSNRENHKRALGFIAQAVQRSANVSPREQLWIDAWADRYQLNDEAKAELQSGDTDRVTKAREQLLEDKGKDPGRDERKRLQRDLIRGLETVVAAHPDDIEAKALLAIQSWHNAGVGIQISSHGAVNALLDQVFDEAPLHPAHHYRIHLWDREKGERALQSAALIGHSAPAIAHQWHMGGHIFARLDRHDDAAWMQEASARCDHAQMMRDRVMPYEIHNYGHNNEWLCRSLQHVGRIYEAVSLAKNMVELPRHPERNRVERGGNIAGYGRTRLLQVLRDFELWDELIACCELPFIEPTDQLRRQADRIVALGTAHFRKEDLQAAQAVVDSLDQMIADRRQQRAEAVDAAEDKAIADKKSKEDIRKAMQEALKSAENDLEQLRKARRRLEAERLFAVGEAEAALTELEQSGRASQLEKALAHRRAGKLDKAIELLEKEVGSKKNQVLPLAHLCATLHEAERLEEATAEFEKLRRVAGHADLDAPPLEQLAALASQLDVPTDWRLPEATRDDVGERPALDSLGPFRWSPIKAPPVALPIAGGGELNLAKRAGRPTLIVFYLGFGCVHCIEQLQAFAPKSEEFAKLGIDIIAIGTQPTEEVAKILAAQSEEDRFPFPLACDPDLDSFRDYRAYDDFEQMPLHSTVLIDGSGLVRWQDISYEPFDEVDWLLQECERLLALPAAAGSK